MPGWAPSPLCQREGLDRAWLALLLPADRCGASGDHWPFLELGTPLVAWCLLPREEAAGEDQEEGGGKLRVGVGGGLTVSGKGQPNPGLSPAA